MYGYAVNKKDLQDRLRRIERQVRRGPVLHRDPDAGEFGGLGAEIRWAAPDRRPRTPSREGEHRVGQTVRRRWRSCSRRSPGSPGSSL
jgi:hypothetical protein